MQPSDRAYCLLDSMQNSQTWIEFHENLKKLDVNLSRMNGNTDCAERVSSVLKHALTTLQGNFYLDDALHYTYLRIFKYLKTFSDSSAKKLFKNTFKSVQNPHSSSILSSLQFSKLLKEFFHQKEMGEPSYFLVITKSPFFKNFNMFVFYLLESSLDFEKKKIIFHEASQKLSNKNLQLDCSILYKSLNNNDFDFFKLVLDSTSLNSKSNLERPLLTELLLHLPVASEEAVLELATLLIQKQARMSSQILFQAFIHAPDSIWNLYLSNYHKKITTQNLINTLSKCHSEPDVKRFKELLSLVHDKQKSFELINFVICRNFYQLASFLLDEGYGLSQSDDLWKTALEVGNLDMLGKLFQVVCPDEDFIEKIDLDDRDLMNLIAKFFFLKTPLPTLLKTIHLLCLKNKKYNASEMTSELFRFGPLLSRNGNPLSQALLIDYYGKDDGLTYQESQISFGTRFNGVVEESLKDEGPFFVKNLMSFWSSHRCMIAMERGDQNAGRYQTFRMKGAEMHTNLPNDALSQYHFIYPTIITQFRKCNESQDRILQVGSYFKYSIEYKGQPLTHVAYCKTRGYCLDHTSSHTVPLFTSELDTLFQDALSADPSEKEVFEQKIAKFYWLGIQLTMTARGNAHYMMMFLSFIYRYHRLEPRIPKITTPMPDLFALVLPLEEFMKDFSSYFEESSLNL